MRRSSDRILTTHTGSLARPPALREMLRARHVGDSVAENALELAVREAVAVQVRRQAEVGLDVVNDGEQGKTNYTAYVKTRLTGFEDNVSEAWAPSGVMRDFPGWAVSRDRGRRPVATEPLAWKDFAAVERDIVTLKAAAACSTVPVEEMFLTTPSPGTFVNHIGNSHYVSRAEYLAAVTEVMRREYEAIANAGIVVQLDCPDLVGRDSFFPEFVR